MNCVGITSRDEFRIKITSFFSDSSFIRHLPQKNPASRSVIYRNFYRTDLSLSLSSIFEYGMERAITREGRWALAVFGVFYKMSNTFESKTGADKNEASSWSWSCPHDGDHRNRRAATKNLLRPSRTRRRGKKFWRTYHGIEIEREREEIPLNFTDRRPIELSQLDSLSLVLKQFFSMDRSSMVDCCLSPPPRTRTIKIVSLFASLIPPYSRINNLKHSVEFMISWS